MSNCPVSSSWNGNVQFGVWSKCFYLYWCWYKYFFIGQTVLVFMMVSVAYGNNLWLLDSCVPTWHVTRDTMFVTCFQYDNTINNFLTWSCTLIISFYISFNDVMRCTQSKRELRDRCNLVHGSLGKRNYCPLVIIILDNHYKVSNLTHTWLISEGNDPCSSMTP